MKFHYNPAFLVESYRAEILIKVKSASAESLTNPRELVQNPTIHRNLIFSTDHDRSKRAVLLEVKSSDRVEGVRRVPSRVIK